MAMEGSSMPSMRFRLADGKLIGDMFATRHRDAMLHKVADAAERLRNGETVILRTTGAQYMQLQQIFNQNDEKEMTK